MTEPRPDHASSSDADASAPQVDEVRIDLPDGPLAPSEARRAVRSVLRRWNLPTLVDSVVLSVSELVTNALRHGRPPLQMIISRRPKDVRVDVHDGGREAALVEARTLEAGPDEESGRGLGIVSALADDAGCELVPGNGKTVYASFDTEGRKADGTA